MTGTWVEWRTCGRKKAYPSQRAAQNRIKALGKVKRKRKSGELHGMHAYECPFCQLWHIGHTPGTHPDEGNELLRELFRPPRLRSVA